MKNTKGPWTFDKTDCCILSFAEEETKEVCAINYEPFEEVDRANANLIAAAPELYEALEVMMEMLTAGDLVRASSKEDDFSYETMRLVPKIQKMVSALAKARGES